MSAHRAPGHARKGPRRWDAPSAALPVVPRWQAIIFAGALVVAVVVGVNAATSAHADTPVTCIAHRGGPTGSQAEETMPVYTSAAADGLTVLDGDVRWSSTGYPYMLHNADMGLFGHASVDLADISGTTASSYRATDGSQIASLYQVSQLLQLNPGVGLEVELKTTLTEAQWAMLATRLDPIRGMTTVTSFSLATVRAAQDHGYRTAYLVSAPTSSTAAPVVDQDYPTITRAEVLKLAAVGVNVEAWTPNTVSEWNALADLGVTAINTDDPRACVTWAAGR